MQPRRSTSYAGFLLAIAVLAFWLCWMAASNAQTEDNARVRYALANGTGWEHATIRTYSSAECEDEDELTILYDHFLLMHPPRRHIGIALYDYHANGAYEYVAPTTTTLHGMMVGGLLRPGGEPGAVYTTYYCAVTVTAQLEPGLDYEFVLRRPNASTCWVEMNQIRQTDHGPERRFVKKFDNGVYTQGCERAFRRFRW